MWDWWIGWAEGTIIFPWFGGGGCGGWCGTGDTITYESQ